MDFFVLQLQAKGMVVATVVVRDELNFGKDGIAVMGMDPSAVAAAIDHENYPPHNLQKCRGS